MTAIIAIWVLWAAGVTSIAAVAGWWWATEIHDDAVHDARCDAMQSTPAAAHDVEPSTALMPLLRMAYTGRRRA